LLADKVISDIQANQLRECLEAQFAESRYVLKNLGVHLSIGVVFAFDVVPLPLGTIARVGWVALAKLFETARGNWDKAKVHSIGVFLIAAIPWFGYAAYLLPLRRDSRELAYTMANFSWKSRTGKTFEDFVKSKPSLISKFARWLVPLPWES
jgi:hypothetical protein